MTNKKTPEPQKIKNIAVLTGDFRTWYSLTGLITGRYSTGSIRLMNGTRLVHVHQEGHARGIDFQDMIVCQDGVSEELVELVKARLRQ